MFKKLEGKTAVITGETERIGLAAAKLFVKEGAYVFITDRRRKELDNAVKEIGTNVPEFKKTLPNWLTLIVFTTQSLGSRGESILFSPTPALEICSLWGRHGRARPGNQALRRCA